jgi:hypothetical protein
MAINKEKFAIGILVRVNLFSNEKNRSQIRDQASFELLPWDESNTFQTFVILFYFLRLLKKMFCIDKFSISAFRGSLNLQAH